LPEKRYFLLLTVAGELPDGLGTAEKAAEVFGKGSDAATDAKKLTETAKEAGKFTAEILDDAGKWSKTSIDIHNPVLDNIRTGSALKEDALHAFNDIIDNYAGDATKFSLMGGDGVERSLYQIEGALNGKSGIFEWIVDPDPAKGVTHRRFIEGIGITGRPNAGP